MSDSNVVVKESAPVQIFNSSLPVTREMLNNLKDQRALLSEFVSSQLRKDNDYGVIPGTKKASLFKPGAEKIRSLFGLNVRLECTFQTIDRDQNFAMFTYKASVYKNDNLISECEGSTNSQEQKYKERKVWRQKVVGAGKEQVLEVTPIFDVINTLQKMAQKRAMVGAIIVAVGASDFFTQDIDDIEDAKTIGTVPNEKNGPIPAVMNVLSQPVHNNQNKTIVVEAVVSYDERDLAKVAGFRYNAATKKWTKTVTAAELEAGFNFEVLEIVS